MKKYFKILLIVGLVFVLSGCTKNYKRSDIIKYVRNEIGIKNFTVSRTYIVKEDYDGYDDRYWTVYDNANNVEFTVLDDYYYSSEMTNNNLENDYYEKFYIKYAKSLNDQNVTYKVDEAVYGLDTVKIYCDYKNKKELESCYESGIAIDSFLGGKETMSYILRYAYPGRDMKYDEENDKTFILDNYNYFRLNDLINSKEKAYYNYFYYGYIYDDSNILSEMTSEDYMLVMNNEDNIHMRKINENNEVLKEYTGLFCADYYQISYNTLYKVLKEEGYQVEGTPHNFKVYYNGTYEFSDSFVDYNTDLNPQYYKKYNTYTQTFDRFALSNYKYYHWGKHMEIGDVKEIFNLKLSCKKN